MICKFCKKEIPDESTVCPECGESLVDLCVYCEQPLVEGAHYCHHCGGMVNEVPTSEILDVTLTEEDIADYCFKGYITKDIKVGKDITVTLKTLTQKELEEIHLQVDKELNEHKNVTDRTYSVLKNTQDAQHMLVALNGKEPPAVLGTELVAIIIQKGTLLQQLVLESLQTGQMVDF